MSVTMNLGRVKPMWRGEYDPAFDYEPMDYLGWQGKTYLCLQPAQGIAPSDSDYFRNLTGETDVLMVRYSDLAGAATRPLIAYGNGDYWMLMTDVTDVSQHVPGDSAVWRRVPEDTTYIATPSIISPTDGTEAFYAEVESSAYRTSSFFVGDLTSAIWQSSTEPDFATIYAEDELTDNPTVWLMPLPDPLTDVWVRVRYISNGFSSLWSPPIKVTIANYSAPAPTWASPAAGTTTVMDQLFTASEYSPNLPDTHIASSWQVFDASDNLIWQSIEDTENLVSRVIPAGVLQGGQSYSIRVRHIGRVFGEHDWSDKLAFTIALLDTPAVTSPAANATGVQPDATITGSTMTVQGTTSSLSSQRYIYRINDDLGNELWNSGDTTFASGREMPISLLDPSQTYQAQVKHYTAGYGYSAWSPAVTFSATDDFSTIFENYIGEPFKGGFVVGKIQSDYDGNTYGLICSDGNGESTGDFGNDIDFSTTDGVPPKTLADGYANTQAIYALADYNATDYSAFDDLASTINGGAGLNGYTDWYIPARDEFEMVYRVFKPTTRSNNTSNNRSTDGFNDGGVYYGINNHSIPAGGRYYSSDPAQTSIASFQGVDLSSERNENALWDGASTSDPVTGEDTGTLQSAASYSTSTENSFDRMWGQAPALGTQALYRKAGRFRAVRRLLLTEGAV